jgi:hypothetical protein
VIYEFRETTYYVRVSDHGATCQGSYSFSTNLEDAFTLNATSSTDPINWGSANTIPEVQGIVVIYFTSSSCFQVRSICNCNIVFDGEPNVQAAIYNEGYSETIQYPTFIIKIFVNNSVTQSNTLVKTEKLIVMGHIMLIILIKLIAYPFYIVKVNICFFIVHNSQLFMKNFS